LSNAARRRLPHAAVVVVALAPAVWLAAAAVTGGLGADPVKKLTHETGDWTLRLLLASLAVTPLRRVSGFAWLAPYRRTLGLLAFSYASLHLAVYALLYLWGEWDTIVEDIVKRPYITVGFAGFLCLLALALTSTRRSMRRLGRNWTRLHRLAYAAGVAGCVHFYWLVKKDVREPLIYASVLALLLGSRAVYQLRPASTKARKSAPLSGSS
jgi:sulfoxide reductase heme-binding subunit YedZ